MVRAAGQDGRARRGNIRCRPSWLSELLKQELRSREGRQQSAIEEEWELDSKALPTQPGRGATAALPNLKPKLTSACAGDIDSSSDCLGARGSGQWMVVSGQTFTSCHPDPERGRRGICSFSAEMQIPRCSRNDNSESWRAWRSRLATPDYSFSACSAPSAVKSFSGRSCGNRITSRIVCESVISIASRSMPMPTPPAGGIPYDSARM